MERKVNSDCTVLNYALQLDTYFNIKIHKVNSICHCYRLSRANKCFLTVCLVETQLWWNWFGSLFNLKKVFWISQYLRIFHVCHNLLLLSPLSKMLLWFPYSNAFSILFIFLIYQQLSVLWQVAFMIIYSEIVWKKSGWFMS